MKLNKKILSMLLSVTMILNMVTPALAVTAPVADSGKAITQCEHHKVHDADCGYTEGTEETPCTHAHTADCYTTELVCGLTEESDTGASASNAAHTHTQDCYKLDCPHETGQHDAACGYTEGTAGTPCTYDCLICNSKDTLPPATNGDTTIGASSTTITAFDALTTDVQQQSVAAKTALRALLLPTELSATGTKTTGPDSGTPSEAVSAAITLTGITWELTAANNDGITAYDEQADQGSYIFTPVLPEGYTLGADVALPRIYVLVGALNAVASVPEQFTLPTGATYYFDLSSEKSNIGTINTAVPDQGLHYVPFTYVGTVNAYSLTSGQASTDATATDRSLFVADYNVSHLITWDGLNTANLIFGKTFGTNYKLRSLSAGSAGNNDNSGGTPVANEWDSILKKSGSTDNVNGWIKNWQKISSWGQDTDSSSDTYRAQRGYSSAAYFNLYIANGDNMTLGFRPALEVLNPATLGSDGLKAVTLNLNGGKLKGSATDINIVCAGDTFTAPSGEAFTRPIGYGGTHFEWNTAADGKGTSYAVGAAVPSSVTTLYAKWAEKPFDEQFTLATGQTYYFDLSSEKSNIGTINTAVPDQTLHYVPFTYVGMVNAYSLESSSSGNTGASVAATPSDRSLFVADYTVSRSITWNDLNTANLIFGKTFDIDYKLRSLSAGSAGNSGGGTPATNEWDSILGKSGSTDNANGWIKNWQNISSWGQDTVTTYEIARALRGGSSATYWTNGNANSDNNICGFRPALEVMNLATLGADGLKAVTLNLNGGKLKDSATDINIVCAGDTFTAPSGEAFTRPNGNGGTSFHWKGNNNQTYAVGAPVPSSVTALTAQWTEFTLPTGNTYYFDLSSEISNIGTINTAVPDATLHYVPFTYAGTVNAYSLESSSSGQTGSSAAATPIDRSLFVADYTVSHSITWNDLNKANLIFGKTFDTDYKLRSLSAGSSGYSVGTPATNEWDSILGKSGSTDNANGWIKNWQNIYSWGQDTATIDNALRALRGDSFAARWNTGYSGSNVTYSGWRPAFEVLNSATLGPDGLKAVTLNLNGGKLKDSATDINIVCAGGTFTAPSGEGLTPPDGYGGTYFKWNTAEDGKGTSYDVGVAVPSSVTALYAQWTTTPVTPTVTSVTVSPKTVSVEQGKTKQFNAAVTVENGAATTVTWTVTGGTKAGTSITDGLLTVATDETATSLTVTATSTVDASKKDTATVTVTAIPVQKYTLTVANGTGGGDFEAGKTVSITANAPTSGKVFDKWTSSDGGTFAKETDATTTFTMLAKPVTVTATYKNAPVATVTSVTVSPKTANVQKGTTQQFNAAVVVENGAATTVTWTVTGGNTGTSISATGLLTVASDETATSLTVTATSTVDTGKKDTATVTVTAIPVQKYKLTVTGGTGSGDFEAGKTVSIMANAPASGKVFDKWTSSDGVTFAKETDATTTFTMLAKNVTVTATYKNAPEQFTLPAGATYYFDLSSEISNIGTINIAVPDATLHYVPFTYAGTVNAYSLESSSSGQTGSSAAATPTDRSLFVADYNVSHTITWDGLNTANLIFGKTFDTDYKLRSLSAGSRKINNIGSPATNEWDSILGKSVSTDNANGWIKNWQDIYSWGQDTSTSSGMYRALRGYPSAAYWSHNYSSGCRPLYGWRPALEVLNPATLGSDGLKAVTLNLNGGMLKDSTANINIVCAGGTFAAPSGEGLTRPSGYGGTYFKWNTAEDGKGTSYDVGVAVPSSVTALYAQWTTPPVTPTVTSVTVSPKTVSVQKGTTQQFNAAVVVENGAAQTVTWTVTGGTKAGTSITDGLLTVASDETAASLTVIATSTVDTSKSDTATVTVTTTPVQKYKLTVANGTGGGDFEANATVSITANALAGKVFDRWTTTDDIIFADATAKSTTFTMLAKSVTVTATYKNAPVAATHTITASTGGGGIISPSGNISVAAGENRFFSISAYIGYSISSVTVDGVNKGAISNYFFTNVTANHSISVTFSYIGVMKPGDSTGGSPTGSEAITLPPIKVIQTVPTLPIKSEIKTLAMMDKNGNASITVTDKMVADSIKKLQAEVEKSGTEENGINLELNVDTGKKKPESISTSLPKSALDSLVENKISEFKITSETVNLNFDSKTLQEIQKQAGGDVTINASKADVSKLSKEARDKIGDRPVLNLSITGEDGKTISDFGGGSVTVSIPYILQPNENPNNLQAYFVDAKGEVYEVTCTYDPVTKCMVFVTNHFSTYGIGYKENAPKFNDIANHWAKNDIEFVAARGLLSGTSNNSFDPDSPVTTKDLAAALAKLSGKDVSTIVENSNKDAAISRQDIALIMQNFAKFTNYNLPKLREKIDFSDVTSDVVTSLQMAGVIMGKDGNRFDPTATATRAEVSAVLRRYVELVIDKATAQGLDMNDSGKIVYYENGKLFTGTKTIDGTTYHFGNDGICVKIDAVIPDTKKYVIHKIVRGDTLWDIAIKNKCTVAEIVGLNGIKNPNSVPIGTELKILQK